MADVVLIDSLGWQPGIHNLGLAYLAASLKQEGHTCEVIDLNNRFRTVEAISQHLRQRQPDYIGFSVKSATVSNAIELHKALLEACPRATFAYGGAHISLSGESILDETPPAYFFRGDAEASFASFVSRHSQGERELQDLPGILYRDASGAIRHSPAVFQPDIDGIPLPDFSVFDSRDTMKVYPLLTSRGCPYHCTYCSVPTISGSRWRSRSAASVLEELEQVVHGMGMDTIVIVDDNFTLNRSRAESICRAILDSGLRVHWSCANGIRADRIWPDLAQLMHQAGCQEVAFGIESWDTDVFAGLVKGEELQDIRKGIEVVQAAGIKVTGFFMIGLPGSTYRKDLRTLARALRLRLDNFYFGLTVPYPGTALWTWAQSHARFLIPWQNSYHISEVFKEGLQRVQLEPVFDTPEYPADQRRAMFRMVQATKAGLAQRSLLRVRRHLKVDPGRPVVLIRSSWREEICHAMQEVFPDHPHLMVVKGVGDPVAGMPASLREAYEILRIQDPAYLGPEDATPALRARLKGALVVFDVPSGQIERYQNVLAFARALEPAQILGLLDNCYALLPASGNPGMWEAPGKRPTVA